MPRKATRISFDSSKRISPKLWIRYDQQTDGQGKRREFLRLTEMKVGKGRPRIGS
jgi:hypothetical protein